MLFHIVKRCLYAIPIALGVTLLSFMLVYLAPGDPLNAVAPADAPMEVIQALKSAYGLDKPVPVQYGLWLARALHGDLGTSIASGRAVAEEVMKAVGNTLLLAGAAGLAGVLLGCLLGALAG
ncbi:MAG: ABC transporter permease, partial [Burkholderiaceae bacterium]